MRPIFIVCMVVATASTATAQDFIRGDLDGDGRGGTISDARAFGYSAGPAIGECEWSWDVNDDGGINIADQIVLLNTISPEDPLFPPSISAPGPTFCGPDPTPLTSLECVEYTACDGWNPPPVNPERVFAVDSAFGAVGGTVTVTVTLDVPSGIPTLNGPTGVGAYCFGISHDPAIATVTDVRLGSAYAAEEPNFFRFEPSASGVTVTMLYSFIDSHVLNGTNLAIHEIDYLLVGEGTSPLTFEGELGVNPSPMMGVDSKNPNFRFPWLPATIDGTLTAEVLPFFRRGDANDDGFFDIADPILILVGLFSAMPAPACSDAHDLNDDALINVADAIYGLSALFGGGPQPPFPGPLTCGWDPTADAVLEPCASSSCP